MSQPAPQMPEKFAGVLTRAELPADLIWSGKQPLPAIGERVYIRMNDFGPAVVNYYFHADGFLGVLCTPEVLPDWFKLQSPGVTKVHAFGVELGDFPTLPVELPLSVLEAGEAVQKRHLNDKQREAKREYPNDPELRKAHCAEARAAWERACARTDEARAREAAPPAG
ncbi:hypothetical protein [Hymenobacter jeollabukensis]|uniref:Uncharacterized protein n=1 Tax=Hymenobacter jeollabukensis TaxID=2025313 RepID=A0A5R8WIU1_9BACT|nr:hypothetical protein [Hymenobacter jeollabukensis]TLM88695.1 hypothetical protein FDY95_22945 [Hymenobacter jeollabukensis]